ncbi:hypothetical protein N2605_16060 [Bradyrhizobium yuanmingense]|nr:hypothetical protein [Bradyrhizobium sp. CB1024]UWU88478.1 hypothetical protein N2605_16060 [Bradyrhizobium sp. CB1024]
MRTPLLILLSLLATSAAESLRLPPAEPPQIGKALPLNGSTAGKVRAGACAAYGSGFVMAEGTGTCVKLGGSTSVDAGIRR